MCNNGLVPNTRSARVREPDHLHNVKGLQHGLQPGLLPLLTTSITMIQSKKWDLPPLTPISHHLLDRYKKAAIVAAGALVVPTTLAIIGFAPAGIAAGEYLTRSALYPSLTKISLTGSIAAGIHSGIGASTARIPRTS